MRQQLTALAGLAALIGAVWGVFILHDTEPREDTWLLLGIGVMYGLAILVMLTATWRWTLRGLGILATMSADCLLYGSAGLTGLGWISPRTEWQIDLIRACFVVGGVLMVIGLIRYMWELRVTQDRLP